MQTIVTSLLLHPVSLGLPATVKELENINALALSCNLSLNSSKSADILFTRHKE